MNNLSGNPEADKKLRDLAQLVGVRPQDALAFVLAIHGRVSAGASIEESIAKYRATLKTIENNAQRFASTLATDKGFVGSIYDSLRSITT